MALIIATISCAGIVGIEFSQALGPPMRLALIIAVGLMAFLSLNDLRRARHIVGGSPPNEAIEDLAKKVTQRESERFANLLARLRAIRSKIGDDTYKHLEEEYTQRLRIALEKENQLQDAH